MNPVAADSAWLVDLPGLGTVDLNPAAWDAGWQLFSPEWSPVFGATWFQVLALIVAVNTIIYAVLAVGKLSPRREA
jgi:hypothetical protein